MTIKQTTINGVPVLLVQLPIGCKIKNLSDNLLIYSNDTDFAHKRRQITLPEPPTGYTWRFINLTKDVTEEQAKTIFGFNCIDEYYDDEMYQQLSGSTRGLIVGEKV